MPVAISALVVTLMALIWPRLEAKLRPQHVADLRAGRKCVRCDEPILEGDIAVRAEEHPFALAHLKCEKEALALSLLSFKVWLVVGIGLVLLTATFLAPKETIGWADVKPYGWILTLAIVAPLGRRVQIARWRRRIERTSRNRQRKETLPE